MFNHSERITKFIYRKWKVAKLLKPKDHPNEEALCGFLEHRLSEEEKLVIEKHLINCDSCAEYIGVELKMQPEVNFQLPVLLLNKIKSLLGLEQEVNILEIFIRLKNKALEILQTTGDVLVGQELVPAPILRSRQINEFKEEVIILKDLEQIRVLAKIQNKSTKSFDLAITIKDKQNQEIKRNLRVTLIDDEIELESRISESGNYFFENILPGNYRVEIAQDEEKVALINLKVQI